VWGRRSRDWRAIRHSQRPQSSSASRFTAGKRGWSPIADLRCLLPFRCPLWVRSGHMQCTNSLYPRKRTCAVQLGMSALGQKRTSGDGLPDAFLLLSLRWHCSSCRAHEVRLGPDCGLRPSRAQCPRSATILRSRARCGFQLLQTLNQQCARAEDMLPE
jgi:hypothetical protein